MNRNRTIGIECELTGIPKSEAVELLCQFMKASRYEETRRNNAVRRYSVKDDEDRSWTIVHDSSIEPKRTYRSKETADAYRVELVSPLMAWNDLDTLNGILYEFADHGATTTKTCGIHVHRY